MERASTSSPIRPAAGSRPPTPRRRRGRRLRFWQHHNFFTWLRLVARNNACVRPSRWLKAGWRTIQTFYLMFVGFIEDGWISWNDLPPVPADPVFVVGHWRSGTTMLHELLALDLRHGYPTTFQCFLPSVCLTTGLWMPTLMRMEMPERRPQDEMPMGIDFPQEDEFALFWSGAPSPYGCFLFPEDRGRFVETLELDGLPDEDLAVWDATLQWFLSKVVLSAPGKRLVLKSPTHSARIARLAAMFPAAKFVHIVRSPMAVYPSTVRTFRALIDYMGYSNADTGWVEEFVFDVMPRLYRRIEEGRSAVAPERFCEVRYEDLVADPVAAMRRVYEQLNLGDFAAVEPKVRAYFAERSGYKTNKHELTAERKAEIARRLGWIFERYGYPSG